jgi:hypothetical protein
VQGTPRTCAETPGESAPGIKEGLWQCQLRRPLLATVGHPWGGASAGRGLQQWGLQGAWSWGVAFQGAWLPGQVSIGCDFQEAGLLGLHDPIWAWLD